MSSIWKLTGGNTASLIEPVEEEHGRETKRDDHVTPAEKRYLEQWRSISIWLI